MAPDLRQGVDLAYGLPLFLSTMVGKHELWALSPEHVQRLKDYLGAKVRNRYLGPSNMTMMARLPRWMKSAKNRSAVLAGLARLEHLSKSLK